MITKQLSSTLISVLVLCLSFEALAQGSKASTILSNIPIEMQRKWENTTRLINLGEEIDVKPECNYTFLSSDLINSKIINNVIADQFEICGRKGNISVINFPALKIILDSPINMKSYTILRGIPIHTDDIKGRFKKTLRTTFLYDPHLNYSSFKDNSVINVLGSLEEDSSIAGNLNLYSLPDENMIWNFRRKDEKDHVSHYDVVGTISDEGQESSGGLLLLEEFKSKYKSKDPYENDGNEYYSNYIDENKRLKPNKEKGNIFNHFKINAIRKVGIENISIMSTRGCEKWSDKDRYVCENSYAGNKHIYFKYAADSWVKNIYSYMSKHAHVEISYSKSIAVSNSYFLDSRSYDKGLGYGVFINDASTGNLVYNNVFRKLRHSMIVSRGANHNVIAYNYSREAQGKNDISIHGFFPYANLFEGNMVNVIHADKYWGVNGPHNTFLRNISTNNGSIILEDTIDSHLFGNVRKPMNNLHNKENENKYKYEQPAWLYSTLSILTNKNSNEKIELCHKNSDCRKFNSYTFYDHENLKACPKNHTIKDSNFYKFVTEVDFHCNENSTLSVDKSKKLSVETFFSDRRLISYMGPQYANYPSFDGATPDLKALSRYCMYWEAGSLGSHTQDVCYNGNWKATFYEPVIDLEDLLPYCIYLEPKASGTRTKAVCNTGSWTATNNPPFFTLPIGIL
ncbi:hypothetical protein [Pseudoalteromonas ardens]|uniref:hypothetical protein n=1 Tax=Pseudoalteromonas ardens TaxID=3048490 RepID=UPI0024C308F4|nr:hypothetical protein [Pseudoalteromonas sp. R96]MDK1310806.1 hypothetical protein [Pseudoalteromonas sp. R96]